MVFTSWNVFNPSTYVLFRRPFIKRTPKKLTEILGHRTYDAADATCIQCGGSGGVPGHSCAYKVTHTNRFIFLKSFSLNLTF